MEVKDQLDFIYDVVYARGISWGQEPREAEDEARDAVMQFFTSGNIDE